MQIQYMLSRVDQCLVNSNITCMGDASAIASILYIYDDMMNYLLLPLSLCHIYNTVDASSSQLSMIFNILCYGTLARNQKITYRDTKPGTSQLCHNTFAFVIAYCVLLGYHHCCQYIHECNNSRTMISNTIVYSYK